MATIQIELPDELYNNIQSLATENNITFSAAVVHILQQASVQPNELKTVQEQQTKPVSEILQRIRSRHRVNPVDLGLLDSTVLIREDRNR